MAHRRRALRRRPHHEARRVAQEQHRQLERIAQLQKARRLVRRVRVDRATQVLRVVGHHAQRAAVDARQRRQHARAEAVAQLQHRALVEERLHDLSHVVDALALLGDQIAQDLLVGDGWGPGGVRSTAEV